MGRAEDEIVGLNHELRASLNAIRNYAQSLQRLTDHVADPLALQALQAITQQAEQALRVLDGLADEPQPHTTTLRIRQRPLDLVPLLQRIVAEQQLQAKQQRLQLTLHNGPLIIQADDAMIEQLLLNLLGNACKYSPPGSEVVIRLERRGPADDLPLELQAHGGRWAAASIADPGIGIAPDEHERVFDKFYRARNAASIAPDGLGIGLYLCRVIAQRHGGTITLQSVLGRGSVFTVYLPIM